MKNVTTRLLTVQARCRVAAQHLRNSLLLQKAGELRETRIVLAAVILFGAVAIPAASDARKEVDIWVARDIAPGPKVRVTMNTRNVASVNMAAYRLADTQLLMARDRELQRPPISGAPAKTWTVDMTTPKERKDPSQRDVYRSKQISFPTLTKPGAYLLVAKGGDKEAWAIVNVTNLAVICKRSSNKALVWVTDFASGGAIASAKVVVYTVVRPSDPNDKLEYETAAAGKTGKDGVGVIPIGPGGSQYVVVSRGNDLAVVPCSASSGDGRIKTHFQTDRPIYRPGQTVSYKAILRQTKGNGYEPVANTPYVIEMRDPQDNVLEQKSGATNAVGTLSGEFSIPAEGAVGPYSLVVKAAKRTAYATFTVAEYRKPEFKASLKPQQKHYLAGEEARFTLQADYYFGAPVQQAEVHYTIRRSGCPYWGGGVSWDRSDDGNLYVRDTYYSDDFIAEGDTYTDDKGQAIISFKSKKDLPDSTYTVACTVRDSSRRQIDLSGSVTVYAAEIRVGVRTDIVSVPLGSNIPVDVTVVDIDGKPAAATLTLTLQGVVWDKKTGEYKTKDFGTTTVDVPATGKAKAQVPAKTEGDVTILATALDRTGRRTRTSISVWVAGAGSKLEKSEQDKHPTISIALDRNEYSSGDAIKSWVTTNTPERPILITAEGTDLWSYAVLPAGKSVRPWSLKTSLAMSPNIYIEAAQWTTVGMISSTKSVRLPDKSRKLNVEVTPDQQSYRPGDQAAYTIHTTGADGKPVSAEVAFSVVDEAIYALRPDTTKDLYDYFWSAWQNRVITHASAPEEVSGGAYQQMADSVAPVRQRFADTAFWNAHVMTGPDGTARVSFETPANLTSWRATARAITSDTKAGMAVVNTEVSRPVMLRLATPRQMVQGDRLTLIATVSNRTDQPHEFETMISGEGIRVDDATTKKITVPANSQANVEWPIIAETLPESGFASITSRALATDANTATAGDLSDALRVNFRIVPNGSPHRIASGGVMDQDKAVTISLPDDKIEPASSARVTVRDGFAAILADYAQDVIDSGRWGSLGASDDLLAAAVLGPKADPKEAREATAALFSRQRAGGWGWWSSDAPDAEITAAVLTSTARAAELGLAVPDRLIESGSRAAQELFADENLWERAALLASAMKLAGHADSGKALQNVRDQGKYLSPFARLSLAEAYAKAGKNDWARQTIDQVLKSAVVGPEIAYMPEGEHSGWNATTVETTAQALISLVKTDSYPELQPKLALWLVNARTDRWLSQHETALAAYALDAYAEKHPQSTKLGNVELTVNGTRVEPIKDKPGQFAIPWSLLKSGENSFALKRDEAGQVFYSVEARVFRPVSDESLTGFRVLRRYEAQDAAGLWSEVDRPIRPSEPVRCTVVVWPNDRPDEIRVTEPIPAGFEFADSDRSGPYDREEVRDGAVIHFLRSTGKPAYFRYYLRSESEGTLTALPAMGEALRRPNIRGNSLAQVLEVGK